MVREDEAFKLALSYLYGKPVQPVSPKSVLMPAEAIFRHLSVARLFFALLPSEGGFPLALQSAGPHRCAPRRHDSGIVLALRICSGIPREPPRTLGLIEKRNPFAPRAGGINGSGLLFPVLFRLPE